MKTETTRPNRQPRGESSAAVLQVDGLCFAHPQRRLFSGWSARIPPGVTLLRGGDGVGKTTLLRLLAGVVPAQGGALCVQGASLAGQPSIYRQQVFWVDPRTDAHDPLTPADWFSSLPALYPSFDEASLHALVNGFGLSAHINKPIYMLSTGSRRKVWLAAAFASGAALTLLDEPFAALDKTSTGFVMELLEEAASHHPTRAWVVADYTAPGDVPLAGVIDLGD